MSATIIATLLPNGEQQFCDANGEPYAGGSVYFYVPGTQSPKLTWVDPYQLVPNTNPVELDAAGRAIIYGAGQYRQILYDVNGVLVWDQLTSDTLPGSGGGGGGGVSPFGPQEVIASATTTDLGSVNSSNIKITGTTEITSFGTSASTQEPVYLVEFAGVLELAYNSESMVLPGSFNITTAAGDYALLQYNGSGNWTVISYWRKDGTPLYGGIRNQVAVASATNCQMTNLASTNNVLITGTAAIGTLDNGPQPNGPYWITEFAGVATLVNASVTWGTNALILPGHANITTAAGDTAGWLYISGTGWKMVWYTRAATAP